MCKSTWWKRIHSWMIEDMCIFHSQVAVVDVDEELCYNWERPPDLWETPNMHLNCGIKSRVMCKRELRSMYILMTTWPGCIKRIQHQSQTQSQRHQMDQRQPTLFCSKAKTKLRSTLCFCLFKKKYIIVDVPTIHCPLNTLHGHT